MGMARVRPIAAALALCAPFLAAGDASAENGVKPRIPVTWEPAPACVEFVDRSVDPVYLFEYDILDEDPSPGEDLLPDEVEDSRTHQFFAFSRQGNPQTEFPYNWISIADVEAAIEKNLIAETTVGPDETLDTSRLWVDRFVRITPDDARRPISHESVAGPVPWDTSTVDAGVYQLWGYTWEPAFNEWAQRTGNIVLVHDGDPSTLGPAAAITNGELIVYSDEAASIEGCMAAAPGTTVDGYFSETPQSGSSSDWQPSWVAFAEDVPVEDDTFAVEFLPGGGHATPTLLVRLVFTDPQGRVYEAHMPDLVNVLPGSKGGCDEDGGGGGFVGMPGCGSGGDDSTGTPGGETGDDSETSTGSGSASGPAAGTGSGSGSGDPGADGGDEAGSGGTCAVGHTSSAFGALATLGTLGMLGLLGVVRRRHRS